MHYESAKFVWSNLHAIDEGENSERNLVKKKIFHKVKSLVILLSKHSMYLKKKFVAY